MEKKDVLVIGAGVAGMEASLLLAKAEKKVYLVEKDSLIGGQTIKFEEVYPNMECATCMVAPKQQEVLHNNNIDLLLLSEIKEIKGKAGIFSIKIKKKARYVSLDNCIGCGECYEPCSVSLDNEFEEGLAKRKAIYTSCPGALPNVPAIDPENCLRLNGKKKDCKACQEACMFDAIDFSEKDEMIDLQVGAVLVSTGFDMFDVQKLPEYDYKKTKNIYTALEFERLYAANGPTEGKLILRDGSSPKSIGIIHCVGRNEQGYCSAVCCMYSTKFSHFLKHKIPDAEIYEFHSDLCVPGKSHEKFYKKAVDNGINFIRSKDYKLESKNGKIQINYSNGKGEKESFKADMVILSPAMIAKEGTGELAKIFGIVQDEKGFFSTDTGNLSSIETSTEGVFVAGCIEGPKDIPDSIAQAEAAAGKILSFLE